MLQKDCGKFIKKVVVVCSKCGKKGSMRVYEIENIVYFKQSVAEECGSKSCQQSCRRDEHIWSTALVALFVCIELK